MERQIEVGLGATFRLPDFYRRNAHLFPSEESLRWPLRFRHDNGLVESGAVLEVWARPGQSRPKILIDESKYLTWMRDNSQIRKGW